MTLVLVHGGGLGAECWDPMLPFLSTPALALDLPGRGRHPADLTSLTIGDFVDSAVRDIEEADLDDVVLVGHSLAGLTIPGVAARLPDRIRRLVFVSCTVPRDGESTYDTLDPEVQALSDGNDPDTVLAPLPPEIAREVFCNDMNDEQIEFTVSLLIPEAPRVVYEPMDLHRMPADIPRTWVRLLQDLIVVPAKQDRFVANLGGADVVDLDAGHMAMISRPAELAAILDRL